MEDHYFKNFAILMPKDILRFPSGTAVIAVSQEEKKEFGTWVKKNYPEYEKLSDEEFQGVFKYWKQIKK